MSKLINDLETQLKAIGATLDQQNDNCLNCDAPSGYVWAGTGTRCLCIQHANNAGQTWLAQAIRSEMRCLKMGLVKETDPEAIAMHRHETGDDTWGAPKEAPDTLPWMTLKQIAKLNGHTIKLNEYRLAWQSVEDWYQKCQRDHAAVTAENEKANDELRMLMGKH